MADGLDLAVSLGGDGTMLRTVDLVCGTGVPVLGVNVGHLGYLTEVDPDGLRAALKRFFAGDYRIEERMTLLIEVIGASSGYRHGGRSGPSTTPFFSARPLVTPFASA